MQINVVQYNILSSGLVSPEIFIKSNPRDLDSQARFNKIIDELKQFIIGHYIICLQEVSQSWAGPLYDFFNNAGYTLIINAYGNVYSDYMGLAIAYPTNMFYSERTQILHVGSYIPTPSKIKDGVKDEWTYSNKRPNTALFTTLISKATKIRFVLVNYHMPAAHWWPTVLTIHLLTITKLAQSYARDLPLIMAGDYNLTPESYQYGIITSGMLDTYHPEYPDVDALGDKVWDTNIHPMKSAYVSVFGEEPIVTSQTWTSLSNTFTSITIDYVFYSGTNITPIGAYIPSITPTDILPNQIHASDHLPLIIKFELSPYQYRAINIH